MNSTTDAAFVQDFLHGTLAPTQFHHRDHVRLGWYIARRHALSATMQSDAARAQWVELDILALPCG